MLTQSHKELVERKGNIIMCSADVASALTMAGVLDYTPALNANLNVDDTGNTFAGVLQGKYRVYIDPYSANSTLQTSTTSSVTRVLPYDAGLFYCPYVPLQMVRAVGENSFQSQDRIQDSLWSCFQPIRRRNNSGTWTTLPRQQQPLLPEALLSRTSCDPYSQELLEGPSGPSFFYLYKCRKLRDALSHFMTQVHKY